MSPERIKLLHSRYNPRAEAERYVASLSLGENTKFLIIIEPGLCYLVNPLRKRFPNAKIIALHAEKAAGPLPEGKPDSAWHPGAGCELRDFLEQEIPDTGAAETRLLEWRPALNVYGNAYRALVKEAVEFIKHAGANARTVKAFGQRWFRNFFKNLEILRNVISPFRLSLPLLITGAGPGLEEAVPLIRDSLAHNALYILAASSSAEALLANGIVPDILISTDGGSWARYHLHEYIRDRRGSVLAAALTAALPSQCETLAILPVSDGSLWQNLILTKLGIPFMSLPQRGTVTASALDLALALTDEAVFISGIDLANNGIRSHARPYSLDRFQEEKAGRLSPFYSQTFGRSAALNEGGSFRIYASWFEKQLASFPKRIFTLGKNNPLFDSLGSGSITGQIEKTSRLSSGRQFPAFRTIPVKPGLAGRAVSILTGILAEHGGVSAAEAAGGQAEKLPALLAEELAALLFPGCTPSREELTETVLKLAGPKTGNYHD